MIALVATAAWATVPDGRTAFLADVGILNAQLGLAAGVGGAFRKGPLFGSATGLVAARGNAFLTGRSDNPAAGLGTLSLGADSETGTLRFGLVGLLDVAVLDEFERGCVGVNGNCWHSLWADLPVVPLGMSMSPAGGLRFGGIGASGASFSMTLAVQPILRQGEWIPLHPRMDLLVGLTRDVSLHWWAGRYGMAIGFGYALNKP